MKGKDITYKEFCARAKELYGDRYDLSKVDLNNRNSQGKVCIVYHDTNKNLELWITPSNFLRGKCTFPNLKSSKKANLHKIVEKCKSLYGDLYDLSLIEKDGYDEKYKVTIGCKTHGQVKVNMYKLQNGDGCPKCGTFKKKYTTESYCKMANDVHHGYYDLSTVVFNGIKSNITPTCPKHGTFTISADHFLHGHGCVKCVYDKFSQSHRKSQDKYIEDCKKVHGNKYIINESIGYIDSLHDVIPICPIHGPFHINASSFLSGCGCAKCFGNAPLTTEEFIKKANIIHNNFYSYPNAEYISAWTKIKINCPIHGEFEQNPADHLDGKGCKKCARLISKPEVELQQFVLELEGDNVEFNNRLILKGKELDIYIPNKKIAIEYNGLIWHSEKFNSEPLNMYQKTELCEKIGIQLIHVYEDEWIEHKDIVKNKLRHILRHDNNLPCIGARLCNIKEINKEVAKRFLDNFHIQGYVKSSVYIGAYYKNELLGVMSFLKEKEGFWNLTRFTTNTQYRLPGLANKLFKYFIRNNLSYQIKTFLDRRWGINKNNVYYKMDFKLDKIEKPDYYYIKGQNRCHKFNFRKKILNKKYGLPLTMTESEMCKELKFYKIWNCGLYKYIWRNNQQN